MTHRLEGATDGLTPFAPTLSPRIMLIDMEGTTVHEWGINGGSLNSCMMLPNGNLWTMDRCDHPTPMRIGAGGLLREYDWDGNVVWEHIDPLQHHDSRRLPNGGAVYLAWELLDDNVAQQINSGIFGTEHKDGVYSEVVREVDEAGRVVWEWRASSLDFEQFPFHRSAIRKNYGHANAIDVLPNGDYLVSFKVLNTIAILSRQSGELVWSFTDEALGGQHDTTMTPDGTILAFGNGAYSTDLHHSAIWEIDPKTSEVVWKYTEKRNPLNFFSPHISGCQRLWSGNTLICEGNKGCLFEVTQEGDIVREFISPHFVQSPQFGKMNWLFRARWYAPDSPEITALGQSISL